MVKSWTCNSCYSFTDENFAKIFSFFVIECPVENVSVRAITFEEKKVRLQGFVMKLRSISPDLYDNWYPMEEKDTNISVDELMKSNGIFSCNKDLKEIAIFKHNNKIVKSFFYCIRCAFAHGGFCIHNYNDQKFYCFENIDMKNNPKIIKARIILKEKTLLEIINYCKSKL